MKVSKVLCVVIALSGANLALAEGGGDRVFDHVAQLRLATKATPQQALSQQQKDDASAVDNHATQAGHASC